MTEEPGTLVNKYLWQMAENLPLFERFNVSLGLLKNLTLRELHTIVLVGRLGSPRMSELAQRGHVTLGTMTVMINKLVKKGYIKRRRDAKDRRVVHVSLTARGRKVEKLHEEDHRRIIDLIMAMLTESEQKEIIRLIQKIATALS